MADRKCFVTCYFQCMVFSTLWLALEAKDAACGSSPAHIDVTSSGGVLYTPGYPEEYPSSVTCSWLLQSKEPGKVLQLRPLDLQLGTAAKRQGACAGDFVTAYDGQTNSSLVLHVWCGEDVMVVYSTGAYALLTFVSDRHRRYRGFALRYSLLTLSDNSCDSDTVRTLPLQSSSPVVADFSPSPSHSHLSRTCIWRLVVDDVRNQVVIDLVTMNGGLACEDGNFSIYDGPETSSPEVLLWCAPTTKPFSSVFLSGGQGMVVVRTRPNVTSILRFRFYTRPKFFPQCSLSNMPTVELKEEDPVYISFPYAVNDSYASCPVQVLSSVTHVLWARIDVLKTVGGYQPSCLSSHDPHSSLAVLQTNETHKGSDTSSAAPVLSSCLRGDQPVYWPISESVILSPPKNSRGLLIKITPAIHGACHGRLLSMTAPTDETVVVKDPPESVRTLRYSRSAWCRYVVSGQHKTDHVLVNIEAELCEMRDICGDYVKLYDGHSTQSPVLYDSENRTHVTVHAVSTGRQVTLEWVTDDRDNRGFIQADFNSVPGPDLCNDVQHFTATSKAQNLSSINYPHYYPVNYLCQYCITSDKHDRVIYITVVDSDLSYSCSDVVEVYDGADGAEEAGEYLGRFCAQEKPRFISQGPRLCLLFRSDPSHHGRGWLLSYRAAAPPAAVEHHGSVIDNNSSVGKVDDSSGSSHSSTTTTTTTATAVVALVVLFAVIVVFIVYIVKSKRQQRQSNV